MRSVVAGPIGRRQMMIAAGAALVGTTLPHSLVRAQPALKTLYWLAALDHAPRQSIFGFSTISLARDGKTMLTSYSDGHAATLWDLTTDRRVRSFELPHMAGAYIIGDGKTGVIAGSDKVVLWDLEKGTAIWTITSDHGIRAIAVAPNGRSVAIGDRRTLSLWDFRSRTRIRVREVPGGETIMRLAFSPDGKWLAGVQASSLQDSLRLYNPTSLAPVVDWPISSGPPGGLAFSPDSRLLFYGGMECITVFDIAGKRQIARIDQLGPKRSFFSGMAVFRNGQMFATADSFGHLLIGSLASKAFIARSPDPPIAAQRVAISPDERLVYVGTGKGYIEIFSISDVVSPS